jgi:hypothetical protein
VPERLPLQQFHGDEASPIGLVDFVDGADVRVVQRGRSLGLPLEATEGLRIMGEFVGQELQCDVATQLEVFRLIHNAHAPAADLAQDAVMGNRLPDGLDGCSHWVDMLGGVLSGGQSNRSGARRDLQTRLGPSADLVWVDLLACDMQLFRVAGPQGSKRQIDGRWVQSAVLSRFIRR